MLNETNNISKTTPWTTRGTYYSKVDNDDEENKAKLKSCFDNPPTS